MASNYKLVKWVFLGSFLVASAESTLAQDVNWINPLGGVWEVGSNWSTGAQPSGSQRAVFNLTGIGGSPYAVSLSSDRTISSMLVFGRPLTLSLNGRTLLTNTLEFNAGIVNVANGTFRTMFDTRIGELPSITSAIMNIGANGIFRNKNVTFNERVFNLGYDGRGVMNITSNGLAEFDLLYIGGRDGSGLLTLNGPQARANVNNTFHVGRFGDGEVRVLGGAKLTTNGNPSGPGLGFAGNVGLGMDSSDAQGIALVDGVGSQWDVMGGLLIGRIGTGQLTISNGGTVVSGQGSVQNSGSDVLITGAGSLWRVKNGLSVGGGGVEVRNQGFLQTGYDPQIVNGLPVQSATSIGSVLRITGVGTEWQDNQNIYPDRNSVSVSGALYVEDGALAKLAGIKLSSGELYVRGPGTVVDADLGGDNKLTSSGSSSMFLIEQGGRLETAGAELSQGTGTVRGSGTLWDARLSNRTLTLGLSSGSSPTATGFHLNIDSGGIVEAGSVQVLMNGTLDLDGGTLDTNSIQVLDRGTVKGDGIIRGPVDGSFGSTVSVNGGWLTIGDSNSTLGVVLRGSTEVIDGRLDLLDSGFADLDGSVSLSNSLLWSENGIRLGVQSAELSGSGTVAGPLLGSNLSTIQASGGTLIMGDATRFNGFRTEGLLNVGSDEVVLRSAGFSMLGYETQLNGGTLIATKGVALEGGDTVVGSGAIQAPFAGSAGSMIQLSGDMSIGSTTRFDGFQMDGMIDIGEHRLTIQDANRAELGGLTMLGSNGTPGVLNATRGLEIGFADGVIGHGRIETDNTPSRALINNGSIVGNSAAEMIELTGYVKGTGSFENVTFSGTFSPGLSPATIYAGNLALAESAVLEIELGGLELNEFDRLLVSGDFQISGQLVVNLINGHFLSNNQEYLIAEVSGTRSGFWTGLGEGDIVGNFGGIDLFITYSANNGQSVALFTAVPEPSSLIFTVLMMGLFILIRRRNACQTWCQNR